MAKMLSKAVIRKVPITLQVVVPKEFRLRIAVAILLVRVAAFLMGGKTEVKEQK